MGKGNRGFKPQGMVNPLLLARLSRPVQTGPTIRDRLEREGRPSWDDVKKVVHKKEKASSDYLEQWENEHYREELTAIRESKRGHQEREQLKELSKHSHRHRHGKRRRSSSSDKDEGESNTDSRSSSEDSSRKPSRHRRRRHSSGDTGKKRDDGTLHGDHSEKNRYRSGFRGSRNAHQRSASSNSSASSRSDLAKRRRSRHSKSRVYEDAHDTKTGKKQRGHEAPEPRKNPHKFSTFMKMASKL